MRLGLSGVLTRTFIRSPLTPLLLLASLGVGTVALLSLPREEEPRSACRWWTSWFAPTG